MRDDTADASGLGPTDDGVGSSISEATSAFWRARRRSRLRQAAVGLMLGAWVVALALIAVLLPPYLEDRALDRIVEVVALDWRDFGRTRADQRLQAELAASSLVEQGRSADCHLEVEGEGRTVSCRWQARLVVPGFGVDLGLPFGSVARLPARERPAIAEPAAADQ